MLGILSLFVEQDLVGALVAGFEQQVSPALVQLVYLGGGSLWRLILVLLYRYAFTDLGEGDLVLYFAHTDELVLHGLGGRRPHRFNGKAHPAHFLKRVMVIIRSGVVLVVLLRLLIGNQNAGSLFDGASVRRIDSLRLLLVLDLDRDVGIGCRGVVFDLGKIELETRLSRLSDDFVVIVALLV